LFRWYGLTPTRKVVGVFGASSAISFVVKTSFGKGVAVPFLLSLSFNLELLVICAD
jgi:hypothetical protein